MGSNPEPGSLSGGGGEVEEHLSQVCDGSCKLMVSMVTMVVRACLYRFGSNKTFIYKAISLHMSWLYTLKTFFTRCTCVPNCCH